MVSNFGCKYTYFSANGKTKRRKVRGARSLTNFKWRATHLDGNLRNHGVGSVIVRMSSVNPSG